MTAFIIFIVVVVVLAAVVLLRSVRIVPQASAAIVERFGRYTRTLPAGLSLLMPFVDRVRTTIDLREQVVPFPPQPVITEDNLVVSIDTVIYFQVTDPKAATYEIINYIQAIEQLTVTTLRNIIGGMDLERTLTSREEINVALRGVLDDATGKWGIRVNRVELKAIEPPASIQDSMEKQMRAERDRRAAILSAEGFKQSQILQAEGERQAAILRAEGEAKALALRADGDAAAINKVFAAIHKGNPDQQLLSYQYLQMLPQIAKGDANKVWIVPSELGKALEGIGGAFNRFGGGATGAEPPPPAQPQPQAPVPQQSVDVQPSNGVPPTADVGAAAQRPAYEGRAPITEEPATGAAAAAPRRTSPADLLFRSDAPRTRDFGELDEG